MRKRPPPRHAKAGRQVRPIPAILFAGLLVVILFEYVRPGNYLPVLDAARVSSMVPLVVALFTMLAPGGRPNASILEAPEAKWFGLLAALFVVQAFTADVRMYILDVFRGYVGYLLLCYVIMRQATSLARLRVLFATMIVVHLVTLALYPGVILDPGARHTLGGAFLGDGNDFAWSVALVLPFTLYLAGTSRRLLLRIAFYASFVVLILAVIGTQSRGGTLAVAISMLYLAANSSRRVLALAGIVAMAVIVAAFAPAAYFDRLDSIAKWQTEGSAQGRILAWKSATTMALDHPLVGVGAGHYGVKFGFEYKPAGYHGPYLNTHSIYFLMLAEFGFPGLILLLAILVGNAQRNRRLLQRLERAPPSRSAMQRRLIHTMQASLIGYAVAGMFLSGVYYPHLFVLVGLSSAARYLASPVGRRPASAMQVRPGVAEMPVSRLPGHRRQGWAQVR